MQALATDVVSAHVGDFRRLYALNHANLLDTPAEPAFDRFTRVAARVLRAPIALLTFVDERREYVKSAQGLGDRYPVPREHAQTDAPGQLVVAAGSPIRIDDMRQGSVASGCQALIDLGGIAYLGAPLRTSTGQVLGTLCVLDRQPRAWTAEETDTLEELAATAAALIDERANPRHALSDALFEEIVANSGEGIAIIDPEGRYVQQNEVHRRLLGYSDEELQGQTPAIHYGEAVFQSIVAELQRAGRYRGELTSRRKDGQVLDVELAAFTVRDREGIPRYHVGIKRNITARKRAQRRQEELHSAERLARREAESAVRARDEFLSIASHELRNPVAGIRGAVQLMRRARERGQLDDERFTRYLEMIDTTSTRLAQLTEDLLDVSRLERGKMPFRLREADLAALTQDVVARHRMRAPDHRIGVSIEPGDYGCVVDPDRIDQIISNLLDNAVKYSRAGGEVSVGLMHEGEGVLLQIIDDGIGLPAGEQERIFEPFGRASNAAAESIPGLGIGLYICRRIAEQHGGRLWAESAGENEGTTMRLWLPRHTPVTEEESDA
jgi:PAS domain S-box-containing protein